MSWVIENLIRNRWEIKHNHDINSDSYNDILVIEKAIKNLLEDKLITSLEIQIINIISEGYAFSDIEVKLGISRETISKIFIASCKKIAYYLGGEFTDDGLINHMELKYRLTQDQINKLRRFMHGKLKHKVARKIPTEKTTNE